MQFNPGSSQGIIDEILRITKASLGRYPLADMTRRVNAGLVEAYSIGKQVTGDATVDDATYAAAPIGYQNITSGTNSYLLSGFSGTPTNVTKLEIVDSNGNSFNLTEERMEEVQFGTDYSTGTTGTPNKFIRLGDYFYLRPTPDYTRSNALVAFIDRKPYLFTTSDTTKEQPKWLPQFYLARYAAQPYLEENGMNNVNSNFQHLQEDIKEIKQYWIRVSKHSKPRLVPFKQDNR